MGKKDSQNETRKDAFLKIGMGFLVVLILANTIQLARFGEIVERVDSYNKGVVDELGGFREDISAFGADMNEMRSFLFLPTKDYSFIEKDTEVKPQDEQETSTTEQGIYQFLATYNEEKQTQKNLEAACGKIEALKNNEDVKNQLTEKELAISGFEKSDISCSFKVFAGTLPLFQIVADDKSTNLLVQSAIGTNEITSQDPAQELIAYVAGNKEKAAQLKQLIESKKVGIGNLTGNEEISKLLNDKKLNFETTPQEDEEGFNYHIKNSDGTVLITIHLLRDGTYEVGDKKSETEEHMAADLVDLLKSVDASTDLEKMVAARRAEIESIFQEPGFQDLLESNSLHVETQPREEYNQLLYDIKDGDGNTQFSFVIELSSGLFKVLRNNEEIDLSSLLQGSKKKP